jgi:type I restriction enzyme M protein
VLGKGAEGTEANGGTIGGPLSAMGVPQEEQEFELLDDKYRSPIPEKLRWRNWAANPEGITGDDLLDFVNNQQQRPLDGSEGVR